MKPPEQILNETWLKKGSPIKLVEDKNHWKEIAVEAMERYKTETLIVLIDYLKKFK